VFAIAVHRCGNPEGQIRLFEHFASVYEAEQFARVPARPGRARPVDAVRVPGLSAGLRNVVIHLCKYPGQVINSETAVAEFDWEEPLMSQPDAARTSRLQSGRPQPPADAEALQSRQRLGRAGAQLRRGGARHHPR
jgi:hypothetical protein